MINYALRIIYPVLRGKASSVEVDYDAEKKHVYHMQAELKKRVWSAGCKSVRQVSGCIRTFAQLLTLNQWYIKENEWNSMSYPWSQAYFWYRSVFPTWSHWIVKVCPHSHPLLIPLNLL